MQLVKGLLDYATAPEGQGIYLFTGNSYVKQNGALVMGRGAAKQVRDRYLGIDFDLGKQIDHLGTYGLCMSRDVLPSLGAFQVKYSAFDKANLELIRYSANTLRQYCDLMERRYPVFMNFPGIGNGQLTREEVWPQISDLPDNVFVWDAGN